MSTMGIKIEVSSKVLSKSKITLLKVFVFLRLDDFNVNFGGEGLWVYGLPLHNYKLMLVSFKD